MEKLIDKIKELSAGRAVVMPVFGDAESMATAAVCVSALGGDRVNAVHIDHGMLRKGERTAVRTSLEKIGVGNVISVDLDKFFLISSVKTSDGRVIGPLSTVCDPSDKRSIVAIAVEKEYRRVVKENFKSDICMIGVHSVGGTPLDFGNRAAEIARKAGADEFLLRQPFPLQALAIRMLCNDYAIALTTAQRVALEVVVSQYGGFAAKLIPFRSVGVHDGVRSYKSMAVLSGDGADTNFKKAAEVAAAIDEKLGYINRVLVSVDCDAKAPTYHGSPMHISKETLRVLREADAVVAEEFACTKAVQFFAVLLPFVANKEKRYSIVIRAIKTNDFETAEALIPAEDFDANILKRTAEKIKYAVPSVDMVFYDITSKPPAAIEFE
ncbi:MAG: hypothetical protein IJ002_08240 [Clostridia bacterium]|nr:hypothetical protein [Clostridia bacterium]